MTGADDGLFAEDPATSPAPNVSRLPAAVPPPAMGWSDYLAAAWRNWWIVLLALVVGVGGGLAASAAGSTAYSSETMLAVAPGQGLPLTATMTEIKPEKVATAADLVSGSQLVERAAERAGLPTGEARAYTAVGTASLRGATIDLVVTGPDADVAATLSRSLVEIVAEEYARLYTGFTLNVVDGPTVATAPAGPSRTVRLAVGAVLGLGLGLLLAVARESGRRAR